MLPTASQLPRTIVTRAPMKVNLSRFYSTKLLVRDLRDLTLHGKALLASVVIGTPWMAYDGIKRCNSFQRNVQVLLSPFLGFAYTPFKLMTIATRYLHNTKSHAGCKDEPPKPWGN
ncbi:MAG: hypothetical protein K940chlam3_00676 [Chlamydiae bacterium]|nr:hypothetical protein [Chlamydiota bacterium]